jgi:hypothetical protein
LGLTFVAKSRWHPELRREHALARMASSVGMSVIFVEHPLHIRNALRSRALRDWWAALMSPHRAQYSISDSIRAIPRGVVVPASMGAAAEWFATAGARRLRPSLGPSDVYVASHPWDWSVISRLPASRRVYDIADDWSEIVPERRDRVLRLYERISAEADAVIVAAPSLLRYFDRENVALVPNAVADELIRTTNDRERRPREMVYAGTISERVDLPLLSDVLTALPDWALTLLGPCLSPRMGGRPSREFRRFLDSFEPRVRWAGLVGRHELARRLDTATVGIVPHRLAATPVCRALRLFGSRVPRSRSRKPCDPLRRTRAPSTLSRERGLARTPGQLAGNSGVAPPGSEVR